MLTHGSPKNLWFKRFNSKDAREESLIHMAQRSGCLFVLDGRDEEPDEAGWAWRHMANMEDSEDTTFTFTFRCVKT